MICYLATHGDSGKQYVGLSKCALHIRSAEHESHAKSGKGSSKNNKFHGAIRKFGKGAFTWRVVAEGEAQVIKMLERVLINRWNTYYPKGFNSNNEADEFDLPSVDELSFFEDMDTFLEESHRAREIAHFLEKAKSFSIFDAEAKDLTSLLIKKLTTR